MFKKIIIANRGEIAVRIIRACRDLGITSAVIYPEEDRDGLAVHLADEAYLMDCLEPRKCYLSMNKIIETAKRTGADALHPGYGFLAENAEFAKKCLDAGIVFIGPNPSAIKALGDKNNARQEIKKNGIPIVPGADKVLKTFDEALEESKITGFPLLIKASMGGGGRGMRLVSKKEELKEAFSSAKSESESSFGDGSLYFEKYIHKPRHVEFQILADNYGNVIHLGERECSIQRRFQKMIEESPSPILDEKLRENMGKTAIKAAKAVGYTNLGTIEFILDERKNFYFLEVNTRLQVEHPVTEEVTGIDLVREQIKLASGEKLTLSQDDIKLKGWAFECRITCENPYQDFIPIPGKIEKLRMPAGPGIRVDSGVYEGYTIPSYFDSMIAKLISRGSTREESRARMLRALREFYIQGIHTTIPFHRSVFQHPEFISGNISTHFIEEHYREFSIDPTDEEKEIAALISAFECLRGKPVKAANGKAFERNSAEVWRMSGRMKASKFQHWQ